MFSHGLKLKIGFTSKNFSILQKICSGIVSLAEKNQRKNYPKRIILIRHGQSEANVKPTIYLTIPEYRVRLTEKGKIQAQNSSKNLKKIIGNESVKFYVSPYTRALQTYENIIPNFTQNKHSMIIEPWLREQELGNFHDLVKKTLDTREYVGKFYYRFADGESGADVYNRATLFIDRMFKDFNKMKKKEFNNIVIVCHRFFMRAFVASFLRMTVPEYEGIGSPENAGFWIFEKNKKLEYELKSKLPEYDRKKL